jgi:hypothetical protein
MNNTELSPSSGSVTEDMRTHSGKICTVLYIRGGRRLKGWPNTAARLGWMEESDPEGCDFVSDERSIPLSLTDCTICKCPGLGGLGLIHRVGRVLSVSPVVGIGAPPPL